MSDSNPPPVVVQSSGPKVPVVLVLVVILIAATGYLFYQVNQTRTEMAQMRDQLLDYFGRTAWNIDFTPVSMSSATLVFLSDVNSRQ